MRSAVSIRDRRCHRCDPLCLFEIGDAIDAIRGVNLGSANGSMHSANSIWVRRMDRCVPRTQFGSGEWIDAFREVNLSPANGSMHSREVNLGSANGSMRSAKSIWVRRMDAITARLSSRASTVPHRLMQDVRPIQNDLAISEEYAPASHRLRLRLRFDECRTVVGLAMPPEAFQEH